MRFIVVPGHTNSGPDHWQTHLETSYAGFVRVAQRNWDHVERRAWVAGLQRTVLATPGPLFLIGHSCGAVCIAQWACEHYDRRVAGALVVAPADVESGTAPEMIRGQQPFPREALPLPTHMVVGDNDPYISLERARQLATRWGSTIDVIPGAGHLATADGYGKWPYAEKLIERLSGRALKPRNLATPFS
jgi:predicted alpha/beta hydrolase family esterase